MEGGGCLGTTAPEWVFQWMLTAGVWFGVAAVMFVALMARPIVADWSWRTAAPYVAVYALQTAWYLYGEYEFRGGWDGLGRGVVMVLAWGALVAAVAALVLRQRWLARRGLPIDGGWLRALVGARWVTGAVTLAGGSVTSLMIWVQMLSLRPC